MKRVLLALLLLLSVPTLSPVLAAPVPDTFADPRMEVRARALQRELRCLVCQGQSLDESNAPLAADLRHLVRQQMAAGRSDAEIKTFLVTRYGDFILMQPPVQPDTYLLWLMPFLVLAGAGGVAFLVMRKAKKAAQTADSEMVV